MGQVQLLWGFHLKIMGLKNYVGFWKSCGVCCFLVGDWWGNGNCRGVFSLGSVEGQKEESRFSETEAILTSLIGTLALWYQGGVEEVLTR